MLFDWDHKLERMLNTTEIGDLFITKDKTKPVVYYFITKIENCWYYDAFLERTNKFMYSSTHYELYILEYFYKIQDEKLKNEVLHKLTYIK